MSRVGLMPEEGGGSYKLLVCLLAGIGIIIAAAPMAIIVIMSFSAAETSSFPPSEFSLRWYETALTLFSSDESSGSQAVGAALSSSLLVGLVVMVLSVAACIPLAYALVRGQRRLRQSMELLFTLPLVFPLVMLGIAFLLIAESLRWELGIWRLIIPHLALVMPFVLRNCMSAMQSISRETEEAAISLGASPLRAGLDIVVPLMKPGILAGLIFAFIISFNEFTITFFMYTIDQSTLPIWMYSRTVSSLDPSTLALSVFIILIDLVMIIAIDKIIAGRSSLF